MGDRAHPKPYNGADKKPITADWKRSVLAKLAANKAAKRAPATVGALATMIDADKSGLARTLDPDGPQNVSSYVDAICDALDLPEPLLVPPPTDDELERELARIRRLPKKQRDALLAFLKQWRS